MLVRGVRRLGTYWDRRFGERLAYLRFGTLSVAITLVFLAWLLDVFVDDVIGGLMLFDDKPFRVGDLCRLGEGIGHIEEIGLRSTRFRTLERSLVSIPNADLAVMKIDNLGQRDMRLLHATLGLRYETTPDQMRWVLAKIREMLLAHPKVSTDDMRRRFLGYEAYSLDI